MKLNVSVIKTISQNANVEGNWKTFIGKLEIVFVIDILTNERNSKLIWLRIKVELVWEINFI